MTLAVAKEYPTFLQGQMWIDVKAKLREKRIKPIYADAFIIETNLENCFNVAASTKNVQLEVVERRRKKEAEDEEGFFKSILQQKEQELQVQLLMKKSRQPKSSIKSRREAKARKEQMLKESLCTSQETEFVRGDSAGPSRA